jgi:flagella basal body P-ring formation protein FlgA
MIPKSGNRFSDKILRKGNPGVTMKPALSFLLLAFAITPAAAQTAGSTGHARLKAEATVSSDIVRIGDLIENAGVAAKTPVFRAPDLGQTGAVAVRTVLDAVRPYGLTAVEIRGLTEVAVTRASNTIAADDIEARIVRALTARHNLGKAENLKIMFDRDVRPIQLETSISPELSLARLNYDASSRRFDIAFELANGAPGSWRYAGTAVETIEAAVATRALARGDVVKASDFVVERRPKSEFVSEPPAQPAEIAGYAARRAVRAGQPLRSADLMKAELIQRNDTVTLHYEVPGIVLSMRGKALDSGAEGDTVSVLNIASKRTIQGVVTAPGHVTVMAPSAPARVAARLPDTETPTEQSR